MKSKFERDTEKLKDLTKKLVNEGINDENKFEQLKNVFSYIGGYISNGNLYQTNKELEGLDAIHKYDPLGSLDDRKFKKETYWEMLRQAQYWQNVFIPKNWDDLDDNTKQAVKLLLTTLFLFGTCALFFDKEKKRLIPYVLYGECNCDMYGQITSGEGVPAALSYKWGNLQWNDNLEHTPQDDLKNFYKQKLDTKNCVFFQWNQWKLGAIILYTPLVNQLLDAQERVQIVARLTTIMCQENCYFGRRSYQENNILRNKGFIHKVLNNSNYEFIEKKDYGQTLIAMMSYYEWLKSMWYEKVGRRFNINEKQERNINSEVQYSQLVFSILEKEHLTFLQIGAKKVEKLSNIKIEFTLPTIENDTFQNQELQENNFKLDIKNKE